MQTQVEYPTDTGLLYEAVRKALRLAAELADRHGLTGSRQAAHHLHTLKKARRLQTLKHSTAQDETKRQAHQDQDYLARAEALVGRLHETRV